MARFKQRQGVVRFPFHRFEIVGERHGIVLQFIPCRTDAVQVIDNRSVVVFCLDCFVKPVAVEADIQLFPTFQEQVFEMLAVIQAGIAEPRHRVGNLRTSRGVQRYLPHCPVMHQCHECRSRTLHAYFYLCHVVYFLSAGEQESGAENQ